MVTAHIAEIYFRAWKKASGDFLETIESSCVQDLMQNAIFLHRSSPVYAKVRKIVSYFHSRKGCEKVDKMLSNLYKPILWKALSAPNFEVRANATLLFTEAFPVLDMENGNKSTDEAIQKQLDTVMVLLDDPHPTVRSNAILGVCKILAKYWELLPAAIITDFLKKLVMELAFDSSSPDVRCSVFKCLIIVLDNSLSHPILEKLLQTLKYSLHDNSEKVRIAFLDMLIKVKAVRAAKVPPPLVALVRVQHGSSSLSPLVALVRVQHGSSSLSPLLVLVRVQHGSFSLSPLVALVRVQHGSSSLSPLVALVRVQHVSSSLSPLVALVRVQHGSSSLSPLLALVRVQHGSSSLSPLVALVRVQHGSSSLSPLVALVRVQHGSSSLSPLVALVRVQHGSSSLSPLVALVRVQHGSSSLSPLVIDSLSVSKRIVDLLFKSFFPVDESDKEWCSRCITLIQMNPAAARKFYTHTHKHTAPTNI
ncbi:condensin-2 complex subunit G2-like, partial [Notothenia coriiceps]|uniref:Condensin-2 complex subunit G2-like n=1 Tax=Notothenia coriiceps TaxID=8208 RepID=A0A6I9P9J5_9TELE